jgi:hypothetical protein
MNPSVRAVLCPLTVLLFAGNAMPGADEKAPSGNELSSAKDGLSVNRPGTYGGYTLVAPMNSTSTYLIDMEGRIVNEWKSEYTPALSAYLLENGHLLRPAAMGKEGFAGPDGSGAWSTAPAATR